MWNDIESDRDFLNFTGVADSIAELIGQSENRPISIGLSGAWGVGKTTLINLTKQSMAGKFPAQGWSYEFVIFNAWLYQGYDDARAALVEIIYDRLNELGKGNEGISDKLRSLAKRIDWLRAAKLIAGSAAALAIGLPPVGLLGAAIQSIRGAAQASDTASLENAESAVGALAEAAGPLVKPKPIQTPPKEIHALRSVFEEILAELKIKLVVLIDDLDRCLPETTISTLEAIRLFLFINNTAFVIAADTEMIKSAVRKHFSGMDDNYVTNYFDKLIQVPLRVPQLGIQEVRCYMMLLHIESSELSRSIKDGLRDKLIGQLKMSWKAKRIDDAFVSEITANLPAHLTERMRSSLRLAGLMTRSTNISGNPRLIKRFMNAVKIRMSLAHRHGVTVPEPALTKMLLFERCGDPKAYQLLISSIQEDAEGRPSILREWEDKLAKGEATTLPAPWGDSPFVLEWLKMQPHLADIDLRGALYVSREYAPLFISETALSEQALLILGALAERPSACQSQKSSLAALTSLERSIILDRLIDRAHKITNWGAPDILDPCLLIIEIDPTLADQLVEFLRGRPPQQIAPGIIPKLRTRAWSVPLFQAWKQNSSIDEKVKKAMDDLLKPGR